MKRIYESFALKKKDKTPLGQFWLSEVTKKFLEVMEASSLWWSHRETHSLIKMFSHQWIAHKNWPFSDLNSHSDLRLPVKIQDGLKWLWGDYWRSKPHKHDTGHSTVSLVIFIPGKFNLKWKDSKSQNEAVIRVLVHRNKEWNPRTHPNTHGSNEAGFIKENYQHRHWEGIRIPPRWLLEQFLYPSLNHIISNQSI